MSKYSFEFKKKIVTKYLNGEGGCKFLADKYGIAHKHSVEIWVSNYKSLGDEGLLRSRKNHVYSFEFKLSVVELYLSNEFSYQELALSQGIHNPSLITRWVNEYRIAGPEALRPKKKGRKKSLNSKDNTQKSITDTTVSVDTSMEHIKQLEDELLKLRIENAFLKELRRLRLEDEAKMKDLQESSAVSEDSLD